MAARRAVTTLQKTVAREGWFETVHIWFKKGRRRLFGRSSQACRRRATYRSLVDPVFFVDNANGAACQALLKRLDPDLIVLGRSRILRKAVIDIPRVGILNGHPGRLPHYRGVDVVRWAIYHGDALGVTVHLVDEGVDTGGILAEEPVSIEPGDTIRRLKKKANRAASTLLAATVRAWLETGDLPSIPQESAAGEQFYRMPAPLRRETDRILEKRIGSRQVNGFLVPEGRNR